MDPGCPTCTLVNGALHGGSPAAGEVTQTDTTGAGTPVKRPLQKSTKQLLGAHTTAVELRMEKEREIGALYGGNSYTT